MKINKYSYSSVRKTGFSMWRSKATNNFVVFYVKCKCMWDKFVRFLHFSLRNVFCFVFIVFVILVISDLFCRIFLDTKIVILFRIQFAFALFVSLWKSLLLYMQYNRITNAVVLLSLATFIYSHIKWIIHLWYSNISVCLLWK